MTNKTGLEKMVEWFGDKFSNTINCEYEQGRFHTLRECEEEARRLLAEEKAEQDQAKPTNYEEWRDTLTEEQRRESDKEFAKCVQEHERKEAPASLWNEMVALQAGYSHVWEQEMSNKFNEVMSRYRPSPKPSESELVRDIQSVIGTHEERHFNAAVSPSGMGLASKISAIISKHTKEQI